MAIYIIIVIVIIGIILLVRKPSKKTKKLYDFLEVHHDEDSMHYNILNIINFYRHSNNLKPYKVDSHTSYLSHRRSDEIMDEYITSGIMTHENVGDEFGELINGGADNVAEILARGYKTSAGVVEGWKKSPKHNAKLLSKNLQWIGIGISIDKATEMPFYCILFGEDYEFIEK